MNKQEILNQLRRYQKQCSTTETIMAFGSAIALVEQLDENEKQESEARWEPKKGEGILVRDSDNEDWQPRIFFDKGPNYTVKCLNPHPEYVLQLVKWKQYKRLEL
jgi:predicted RNase H-like nuclease (RuvC/YqgF family)